MKINKISRRAFLLGLGAVSTAALLSACGGSASYGGKNLAALRQRILLFCRIRLCRSCWQ